MEKIQWFALLVYYLKQRFQVELKFIMEAQYRGYWRTFG